MARKVTVENIGRTVRVDYRLPSERELQILTTLADDETSSIAVRFTSDRQVHDSTYYYGAVLLLIDSEYTVRIDVFYQLMLNGWIEPYIHMTATKVFTISRLGKSLLNSLTHVHHRRSTARQSA